MRELAFRRVFTVDACPERLWPLLSHTDRLNRALGLPPVRYAIAGDGPRIARSSFLGMPLEWEEHPFEWVFARHYSVERVFRGGPIRRVRGGIQLNPRSGRTDVEVYADVEPRNPAGWVVAKLVVGPKATRGVAEACANFARFLSGDSHDAFAREAPPPRVDRIALNERISRVSQAGVPPDLLHRLVTLVVTAHDEEVLRIRPFELADRWNLPRVDVLRGFLHAAAAGVFDLDWDVLCPNCRIPKTEERTLGRLQPEAHCEFCDIRFDLQFDLNVELRFSVNPNVRAAENAIYCIGGPGTTPHVLAQSRLRPGSTVEWRFPLSSGTYRVRIARGGPTYVLDVAPTATAADLSLRLGDGPPGESRLSVRSGEVGIRIESGFDRERLVLLEDRRWHSNGASAARVTSLQEFRDLFSSEVLAPGLALSIRSLAILFTDLRGSTAMYERLGDSPAFGIVRRHFDLLLGVIRENQGTLVKTIGDAVMAAFASDTDAVAAALEAQKRVARFNRENPGTPITVKIGAHSGPCVAVNGNGALDYFGTTVNLASRIQDVSEGEDVVLSQSLAEEPGVRALLEREGVQPEVTDREVKGISRPVRIARLRTSRPAVRATTAGGARIPDSEPPA